MMQFVIPLIGSYFSTGLGYFFFFPLIALAFVSVVPGVVRAIFGGNPHV